MSRITVLLFSLILSINPIVNAMDESYVEAKSELVNKLRHYITGTTTNLFPTAQKRFVFTGAPSAGKSTIIKNLARLKSLGRVKGFPEAATDHIRKRQREGVSYPWVTDYDFQTQITHLINRYEADAKTCGAELIFLDRGTIDSIGYQLLWEAAPMQDIIYQSAQKSIDESFYEPIVFLIEPIGFIEDNGVRCENYETAVKIADTLELCYKELGFQIIRVENEHFGLSIENRVKTRMKKIIEAIAHYLPQPLNVVLNEINEMNIILEIS